MTILYIDGSTTGDDPNTRRAGCGAWGYTPQGLLFGNGVYLGEGITNNEAEYAGLILGLYNIIDRELLGPITIFTDSYLLVGQMNGNFKVKNESLKQLHEMANTLVRRFPLVFFNHIGRSYNYKADVLAKRSIDNNDMGDDMFFKLMENEGITIPQA